MNLSDEQMAIIGGQGVSRFEPFDLPTGRQDLPAWVRGARVDWMFGCANAPHVRLKVVGNVRDWENQTWSREGASCYIARHADGRAEVLYHDGAVSRLAVWRVFGGDAPITYQWLVPKRTSTSESWADAAEREAVEHMARCTARNKQGTIETYHGKVVPLSSVRFEVKEIDVTTEQSGFGGSGFMLKMMDGTDRLLRGPWHGGAPKGYVEVNPIDITSPYGRPDARRPRPWHRRGGTVSYVTEDLFLRILAAYCPHVGVAHVQHSYGARVECFDKNWGASKAAMYELEIGRARRGEPAGQFWRLYWDGSERYCGSLRIPSHGFRPEVTDIVTA